MNSPCRSSSTSPRAICVRAPNWVGDVVMATPAFRAIRMAHPRSSLTVVIRAAVAPILRNSPWFDHQILYSRDQAGVARGTRAFLKCVSALRERPHQLGILLPNSFSSALMFLLAGVRERIGYRRDARSWMLTRSLERPTDSDGNFCPTYMVDYYLRVCEVAGVEPAGRRMALPYTEEDRQRAHRLLRKQHVDPDAPLHLMHPCAGYGPSKLWEADRFAVLADRLRERHDATVAVIGSPVCGAIARRIRERASGRVVDLTDCGVDLHLLKCVVSASDLLVTTDSGPRHYGVALGVPTVCLMGPTDPRYSTSGLPHDHVLRVDVECGPCQKKSCARDHRCMTEITPEMAYEACETALKEKESV